MTPELIWEFVGFLASFLVLISLIMSSVIKLRVINTVGSFVFAVYGLAIQSYPTAIMNGCLVVVNIYYLVKLLNDKKTFQMVACSAEEAATKHFLSLFNEDLVKFFPDFENSNPNAKTFLIYHDSTIAGIVMGVEKEDNTLDLLLDYTTPQFRDCSVGKFAYAHLPEFGIKCLRYEGKNETHLAYVNKMGFEKQDALYVKSL